MTRQPPHIPFMWPDYNARIYRAGVGCGNKVAWVSKIEHIADGAVLSGIHLTKKAGELCLIQFQNLTPAQQKLCSWQRGISFSRGGAK